MAKARNQATVLLIEDESIVRMSTAEGLREHGFDVVEAADGPQAIEILNAGPQPDVVFADLVIPGEPSGLDLARWIRSRRPRLPIILTSGTVFQGVPTNVARAVTELLNEPFFPKPYDIAEVVERMRALLDRENLS